MTGAGKKGTLTVRWFGTVVEKVLRETTALNKLPVPAMGAHMAWWRRIGPGSWRPCRSEWIRPNSGKQACVFQSENSQQR